MKKTALIVGAAFFCLIASVSLNAQTPDTTNKQVPQSTVPQTSVPQTTEPQTAVPEAQTQQTQPQQTQPQTQTNTTVPATTVPDNSMATTATVSNDRWNNWDRSKYAMLPMPEPLTTEKIFPALGQYEVTTKDGATAQVTVTLDEANKGIVWIDGLPEGRIKGYLRQSPATYKIPAQKTDGDKDIASGVFIYDKDANTLNVCVGCEYKTDDPASVFLPADQQPVDEAENAQKKTSKKTAKTKVKKVKPVFYSGSKAITEPVTEQAPATTPEMAPAEPAPVQQ